MSVPGDTLLAAVADTLMPGVRVADDGALRTALAPVARAVRERRPDTDFDAWSQAEREELVDALLADPETPAAAGLRRVLALAARSFYGDPATWPALGCMSL